MAASRQPPLSYLIVAVGGQWCHWRFQQDIWRGHLRTLPQRERPRALRHRTRGRFGVSTLQDLREQNNGATRFWKSMGNTAGSTYSSQIRYGSLSGGILSILQSISTEALQNPVLNVNFGDSRGVVEPFDIVYADSIPYV